MSNRVRVGLRGGCSMQLRDKQLLGKIDISSGNAAEAMTPQDPVKSYGGSIGGIAACARTSITLNPGHF